MFFRRIEQMEETNGDLDLVKDEFGQRLHELERKLQNSFREKDAMKQQMLTMQEELTNRSLSDNLRAPLSYGDIAILLREYYTE